MRDDAAGFSLVELLVALAIGSFAAIGIGGLVGFAGQLKERTASGEAAMAALNDIATLATELERLPRSAMTSADKGRFEVIFASGAPYGERTLSVELDEGGLRARTGGQAVGAASLAAFDTARFDYFAADADGVGWHPPEDLTGSGVLAARVVVTSGHRAWPFVLWRQPP
jgi:prepilin-type N-terminal cleavage/methylation domain-containing protein